jgi:hypothetical protein
MLSNSMTSSEALNLSKQWLPSESVQIRAAARNFGSNVLFLQCADHQLMRSIFQISGEIGDYLLPLYRCDALKEIRVLPRSEASCAE